MKDTILFDLGNTLVRYYEMADFPAVLQQCIANVQNSLGTQIDWERVRTEDYEATDYCVRPLADRLQRISGISDTDWSEELAETLCREFMQPIFALSFVYADVPAALQTLRARGFRTAIVSNTPWGSPAKHWREELSRLGLAQAVDTTVFCPDCGWRKPARQIFDYTFSVMDISLAQCLFIGDDPRWDIVGPQSVGMEALLIDRKTQTLADVLSPILG